VTTRLVAKAQGTARSPQAGNSASSAANGDSAVQPSALQLLYFFTPPYKYAGGLSGGYAYTYKEGAVTALAAYDVSWSGGYLYNYAYAAASLVYGRAEAESFAWFYGPSSSFYLPERRNYNFMFNLLLTGEAWTSATTCTWLGCSTGQSKISFTGKILTTSFSPVSSKECIIYTGNNLPLHKYQKWTNAFMSCSWTARLSSGYYIFKAELFTDQIAASLGLAQVYAHSYLTAYLNNVGVYRA